MVDAATGLSGLFAQARPSDASFERLMPHRVRNILVVASAYDAFVIEEGGRLTELILNDIYGEVPTPIRA